MTISTRLKLTPQTLGSSFMLLIVFIIATWITFTFARLSAEDELLLDSTVGELAVWMSAQTAEDEIESVLGTFAENWAKSIGEETLPQGLILESMQTGLIWWSSGVSIFLFIGLVGVFLGLSFTRQILLIALIGLDTLLFIVPVPVGNQVLMALLIAITLMLIALLYAQGKITRILGFFLVLSAIFVLWESSKSLAAALDYKILLSQQNWEYSTYPSLDEALEALHSRDIDAVVFDRRDLLERMPPQSDSAANPLDFTYPQLRYLDDVERDMGFGFMPVAPEFPGRLSVAVRVEDGERWSRVSEFLNVSFATVAGEFADDRYLSEPRNLVLVDFKILNDINLPHLQTIAEAFMQPARRNGSQLLVRILGEAGLYTWGEAVLGFTFGAVLGFVLGALFAHSALMERSLLPYVVASQTVPILAIAPMVVIWLGASQASVSVIAAYLTFFPVTINTLRGLQSPSQIEVDLLNSYAASHWDILWKLRVPAALPYIFTALKVSATASVVGAIIGELPSGIGDGLGRAILDFSSDYSLLSTPKLWAAIIMAASVGVFFFVFVSIVERLILGRYIRNL